jgi:hypothetical protein
LQPHDERVIVRRQWRNSSGAISGHRKST